MQTLIHAALHRVSRAALLIVVVGTAALGAAGLATASDGNKFALVIGNSQYGGERRLPNTVNDARLMAKTLNTLGFVVNEHNDLGRDRFAAVVEDFAARLPAGATAFVYYAGHGMQIGGSSYLNPVDMPITSETSAKLRSYALNTLLERLAKSKSAVNIVVLDACRNNPFQPGSATRYRGDHGFGLSSVQAPRGTLIAYSTSPGQRAEDGKGSNSLFTATLARTLAQPSLELEAIFRQVRNDVRRQTLDDQIPWVESSLAGAYFFNAKYQPAVAGTTAVKGRMVDDTRGQTMRSTQISKGEPTPWYRQMSAAEWSQIDWEIQQRVKRLTPDEIPALEHKATGGSVMAQTVIGLVYREGIDKATAHKTGHTLRFKANNSKALRWLRKAAEAGFPVAQAELGEMYYAAHGVDRDLEKSQQWLERAAEANYPRAKLDLLQVRAETGHGNIDFEGTMKSVFESLKIPTVPPARAR